jgi:hypothetical protein
VEDLTGAIDLLTEAAGAAEEPEMAGPPVEIADVENFEEPKEPEPAKTPADEVINQAPGELEELDTNYRMSLVYTLFTFGKSRSPDFLESPDKEITREWDGITYVNEETLSPDEETEQNLDPGLKNLINSIIYKN